MVKKVVKKVAKKVKVAQRLPAPKKVVMPETTEGLLALLRDPRQWDDDDDRPEPGAHLAVDSTTARARRRDLAPRRRR